MSDISLDLPWWTIILALLWIAFLPLTAAAVGTVIWTLRRRTSRLARALAFVFCGLWLVSAGLNLYVLVIRGINR